MFEWSQKLSDTHPVMLAVGVTVLLLLFITKFIGKRLFPRLPPLVPVFFVALVCGLFVDFEAMGVSMLGEIRDRTPQAVGLTLNLDDMARLAVGALGLSMLIFPEGVLLSRAMAEKHGYAVNPDRELVALGSANIASGSFLGFTVGGSQTRTLLNSATGGRTQVANLVSAVFLVVFLVFAADWLTHLPKVAIAAILIFTGFGLIDIAGMRRMWAQHRQTAGITMRRVTK